MTPDVNVLVAASRPDHSHHVHAMRWLLTAMSDAERGARLEVLPMVAGGFLRLVTHPKVFPDPTPADLAWAFLNSVLDSPACN